MTEAFEYLSDQELDLLIRQQHELLVFLDNMLQRSEETAAGYRKLMAQRVETFHKLMAQHNHRHPYKGE